MRNYLLLMLLVSASVIYLYSMNPTINVEPDTWHYLIIAKSFSVGNGYRIISDPDNSPEDIVLPLYSLMLTPVFWFANGSFLIARMISAIIAILSIYLFYLISKEFFDKRLAIASTTLMGLSPLVIIYSHKILTEIPYMFFSLLTVYLIFKYAEKNDLKSYAFILPLCLSFLTKISGMILITSVIAYFILKKDFKKLFVVSCIFLLLMGFLYSIEYVWFFSKNYGRYRAIDHLTGKTITPDSNANFIINRGYNGVLKYFGIHVPSNILTLLLIIRSNEVLYLPSLILGFAISMLAFLGYFIDAKKGIDIFNVYALLHSFVFVLLIGVTGNGRYMLPVLPLLIIYFVIGLRSLTSSLNIPYPKHTSSNIILLMFLLSTVSSAILLSHSSHNKENIPENENLLIATQWIKSNVNRSEIIATPFRYKHAVYLFAGNRAITLTSDYDKLKEDIEEYDIEYLLISNIRPTGNTTYLEEDFRLVFSTEDSNMKVYEFEG